MPLVTVTVNVPPGKRTHLRKKLAEIGYPEVDAAAFAPPKVNAPKRKGKEERGTEMQQGKGPIKWPDPMPTPAKLFEKIENGPKKRKLNQVQKDLLTALLEVEEADRTGRKLKSSDEFFAELKEEHERHWGPLNETA